MQNICIYQKKVVPLRRKKKERDMNALQLDADILRNLGIIAENESMLNKVSKYLRRVVKEMAKDPTLMTKEEFFARVEKAEQQYAKGEYTTQLPGESVTDMLRRSGYAI